MWLPKVVKDTEKSALDFYNDLGFTNIVDKNVYAYEGELPVGWYEKRCGEYWSHIKDEKGNTRIAMFHKQCSWDYVFFARPGR